MNQINNNTPDAPDPQVPNNEIFQDNTQPNGPVGPLELSILERVETGLLNSGDDSQLQETKSLDQTQKYKGPREIIFVSGWICVDSVYQRYLWGFVSKILIGRP